MATPNTNNIMETVANTVKEAITHFKENEHKEPRSTRAGSLTQEQLEGIAPLLVTCLTASMKMFLQPFFDEQKRMTLQHNNYKLDQKLNIDKIETYNRQDNIILFGHEEPDKNYTPFGRETQEEIENVLIDAGNKISLSIDRNHISDGFRLGKRPTNLDGSPKTREDGTRFARPIFFRLNKRFTRTALLRSKKTLKETHGIKIAEDITPMRKGLCDIANELESVKVAYPQDGKILVRQHADPTKIIRMESYKDLTKIPGFSGEFDWNKLRLSDASA